MLASFFHCNVSYFAFLFRVSHCFAFLFGFFHFCGLSFLLLIFYQIASERSRRRPFSLFLQVAVNCRCGCRNDDCPLQLLLLWQRLLLLQRLLLFLLEPLFLALLLLFFSVFVGVADVFFFLRFFFSYAEHAIFSSPSFSASSLPSSITTRLDPPFLPSVSSRRLSPSLSSRFLLPLSAAFADHDSVLLAPSALPSLICGLSPVAMPEFTPVGQAAYRDDGAHIGLSGTVAALAVVAIVTVAVITAVAIVAAVAFKKKVGCTSSLICMKLLLL